MSVAKRALDIIIATVLLVLISPLLLMAAIGIALTSRGPILYRARRIGRDRRRVSAGSDGGFSPERRQPGYRGIEFTLYKFRTMRVAADPGQPITSRADPRVFPFGSFLRATKIDELPQLVNVIKGDMTLVGPRPEAPEIVRTHYTPDDIQTLQVHPGVTSPGSLYYYTHLERTLEGTDATDVYAERLLPAKLAIDRVYLKRANLGYDINLLFRTAVVIIGRCVGWKRFPDPPEIRRHVS
jgi:lipopolysaccharide/colanic/teichoic acid biosynthesis glycosyltransferase